MTEPTPGSLADLQEDADPEAVARAIVLRKLSAAPRTRQQLALELKKRGVAEEVSERVLDRYVEFGYIDDSTFAQEWVRARHDARGSSRWLLQRELRERGVSQGDQDAALAQISPEDEWRRARELAERKLRSLSRFDRQTQMRRLQGLLARRGYPPGVCMGVVREIFGEMDITSDGFAHLGDST
jgi:regulatory protein